jgi:hypothetical protein
MAKQTHPSPALVIVGVLALIVLSLGAYVFGHDSSLLATWAQLDSEKFDIVSVLGTNVTTRSDGTRLARIKLNPDQLPSDVTVDLNTFTRAPRLFTAEVRGAKSEVLLKNSVRGGPGPVTIHLGSNWTPMLASAKEERETESGKLMRRYNLYVEKPQSTTPQRETVGLRIFASNNSPSPSPLTNDDGIKADIQQLGTLAKIFYRWNGSSYDVSSTSTKSLDTCYTNPSAANCAGVISAEVSNIRNHLIDLGSTNFNVNSSISAFCISGTLASDPTQFLCTDASGTFKKSATSTCGISATSCP